MPESAQIHSIGARPAARWLSIRAASSDLRIGVRESVITVLRLRQRWTAPTLRADRRIAIGELLSNIKAASPSTPTPREMHRSMRAIIRPFAIPSLALLAASRSAAAHDSTVQRTSASGLLVDVPGFGSSSIRELATIGVGWTHIQPDEIGGDYPIGAAPRLVAGEALAVGVTVHDFPGPAGTAWLAECGIVWLP